MILSQDCQLSDSRLQHIGGQLKAAMPEADFNQIRQKFDPAFRSGQVDLNPLCGNGAYGSSTRALEEFLVVADQTLRPHPLHARP